MKKRIISLIMAVCMVILAVPAFLLVPTSAETKGFTTSFALGTETWPSYTSQESLDGYNGNWSAGFFWDGVYTEYRAMDRRYNILNHGGDDGDQWTYNGIYLESGRDILAGAEDMITNANHLALSMTYNSPYEGTVSLGFETLNGIYEAGQGLGENYTACFFLGVFINEQMIWPVAGGSFDDINDWVKLDAGTQTGSLLDAFNALDRTALSNVKVTKNDRIQFVFGKAGSNYLNAVPTVSFANGYLVVPTTMQNVYSPSASTWPEVGNGVGVKTLTQTDAYWQIGDIDATTLAFAPYTHYFRKASECWASHNGEDYVANGAILLASGTGSYVGSFTFGSANPAPYYSAYEYTAIATGKAEATFQKVQFLNDNGDPVTKAVTAKAWVLVNGAKVKEITITSDASGVIAAFEGAKDLDIVKGDKITIAMLPVAGVGAVHAEPIVRFTQIDSFMTEATTEEYALKVEGANIMIGDRIGIEFNTFATKQIYLEATEVGMYIWPADLADKNKDNATKIKMQVNDDFSYTYIYDDLTIKEISDEITAQAYAYAGVEGYYTSEMLTASVADFAYEQYSKASDDATKELMISLMNYGAYAQTYFNYNTENLANAQLPESLRVMDPDTLYYACFDGVQATQKVCASEINAFSLMVDNTIDINVYIYVDESEADKAMIFQYGIDEESMKAATKQDVTNGKISINDLSIKEMSNKLYMRIGVRYDKTIYYGYTFTYSVESYAARMVDSIEPGLANLVRSMMEFGKAAAAYEAN